MSKDEKAYNKPGVANATNTPTTEQPEAPILSQMEASRPLTTEQPDAHEYFIGATPDCRRTYLTLGGHSFPVFTCDIGEDLSGQDVEIPTRGGLIHLSDSEAERLKKSVLKKGIRFVGESSTTFFATKFDPRSEYPCAMFVFLHKVSDLNKAFPDGSWRNRAEIPTLMAREQSVLEKLGNGFKNAKGEVIPLRKPHNPDKVVTQQF